MIDSIKKILRFLIENYSKIILFLVPSMTTALLVISFANSIDKLITKITDNILRFLGVNSYKISIFIYYIVAFLVILGIYVTNYKIIGILIEYYSNNIMGGGDPKGENTTTNSKNQSSKEEKFDCKGNPTSKASTYSYKYSNHPVESQSDISQPICKENYQYQRYCIKKNYTKVFKRDWNKRLSKKYRYNHPPTGIFQDNIEATLNLKLYKVEMSKITNNFANLSKADKVKCINDFNVFLYATQTEGLGDKHIPQNNLFYSIMAYRNSYISKTEISTHNARVNVNIVLDKLNKKF